MHYYSVLHRAALVSLLAVIPSFAVDTHVWEQSDQAEFARGTPKHIAIRSDGRLMLSPSTKELDSTSVPYLWSVVEDSAGTVYYAGGGPTGASTKVFQLAPNGKPKTFAELPALEVHALAIDKQDRVYAAVLPDAKIYRIENDGKFQVFFDPKAKYVWAMAFDRTGNLFVATGDTGLIYRVTPDGNGSKFFDTEETHARSLIFDRDGNLIVGTEPSGLILRISPKGESFVLYQANKREVTALAEHDGVIYASVVGAKGSQPTVTGPAPVLPATPAPVSPTGAPKSGMPPPSLPPAVGSLAAAVSGGSDLYRIQKDGFAERIWNSSTDLVYALIFDASGHPLLGTGNKGVIYRVDSDQLSTQLVNVPPTQVTSFLRSRTGTIYATTGNVGSLYAIGPGTEMSGTLTSEVLDANDFAYWGKVHITSDAHGGSVAVETRSGNLSNPENNWSPWKPVSLNEIGGPIQSPPARFLQYRLTLTCDGNENPSLSQIDLAYLPRNVAPRVTAIEIAPYNYRQSASTALERNVTASGSPTTLTLPAVGQRRTGSSSGAETPPSATLQYSKGFVTARWSANDPNGDTLNFRVEVRGRDERLWRVLKDKVTDHFYAFDSSALPDGHYVLRVTASDAPANTPENTLSSSLDSDPFVIDNTPPEITIQHARSTGGRRVIRFTAKDALSWIDKAEYSVNGGEWTLLMPLNKVSDSQTLDFELSAEPGQLVAVRVFDERDNVAVTQVHE